MEIEQETSTNEKRAGEHEDGEQRRGETVGEAKDDTCSENSNRRSLTADLSPF